MAYLIGGIPQYILCAFWVFPASPESVSFGYLGFTLLSLLGLGITWAVIGALHGGLEVNYLFAKCVAMGLSFSWNFLSRKHFVFKPRLDGPYQDQLAAVPSE